MRTALAAVLLAATGCAPPDEIDPTALGGPSIEIVAPIDTPVVELNQDGDLELLVVVDIDGVDFLPAEVPPREVDPDEAHYHLGFPDLDPGSGGGYDLPDQVFFSFFRAGFPPGNGYRLVASLQNNDHSDVLDEDGTPIESVIEFNVVPFGQAR